MTASGSYTSPPCYAAELEDNADKQQMQDLTHWRKAERQRQREIRRQVSDEQRTTMANTLASHLDALLAERLVAGHILGGYWPIQGEFDVVFWFEALIQRGIRIALPVCNTRGEALSFRAWTPDTVMERDDWDIPVPPAHNDVLIPNSLLAPCLGWDTAGYRLGYGGGYFDRTLATLSPKPFVVGIGLQAAKLATIFPQTYDIPMDAIVTETGVQWLRR